MLMRSVLSPRRYGLRPIVTRLSSNWINQYIQGTNPVREELLTKVIVPLFSTKPAQDDAFCKDLTKTVGGISAAILLRLDIQKLTSEPKPRLPVPVLQTIDRCIQNWVSVAFCVDSLSLQQVNFDSSGSILECIARADTVHIIRSIPALKKRFQNGRRCYALFHHALPNYPLAFIHIGLTSNLATSMSSLDTLKDFDSPSHAMFYSVNSTNPAFRGLSLAPHLIKEVVKVLQKECPTVKTFSTLSPIPDYVKWLNKVTNTAIVPPKHMENIRKAGALISTDPVTVSEPLSDNAAWAKVVAYLTDKPMEWGLNTELQALLKDPLMWLACNYITTTKESKDGSKAVTEPVANFHMGNGAVFHQVNWMGNPSLNGLRASAGLMVNYLYDLPNLETNKDIFRQRDPAAAANAAVGAATSVGTRTLPLLALGDQVKSILSV